MSRFDVLASAPVLDPVRWVEAFNGVPATYKGVTLGVITLFVIFRWWPWRKRNGQG
jgi:hypothetical protein